MMTQDKKPETETPRLMEVMHDETPSQITDHPFESRGEWWDLCKHCRLAESAHAETTNPPFARQTADHPLFEYYSDVNPDDS